MVDRNSKFYDFPVQFPFGRNHTGLNGACFALFVILVGLGIGIALIYAVPVIKV